MINPTKHKPIRSQFSLALGLFTKTAVSLPPSGAVARSLTAEEQSGASPRRNHRIAHKDDAKGSRRKPTRPDLLAGVSGRPELEYSLFTRTPPLQQPTPKSSSESPLIWTSSHSVPRRPRAS
ncbi:hypothetical protein GW17_00019823 [Ensete ventricosum]|nr:hypothetical protein GW17_00019823 [Ensete ventricosum]RZR87429.1 hypothetical protein BHM03_00014838 [Ensete ventricosum]